MSMVLAELVELVIGVDIHADTHTATLVALAEADGKLRGWAIEGTGGYGAGLARHLDELGELVVELDRPVRPARRAGAKSDAIDAERSSSTALRRHLLPFS